MGGDALAAVSLIDDVATRFALRRVGIVIAVGVVALVFTPL